MHRNKGMEKMMKGPKKKAPKKGFEMEEQYGSMPRKKEKGSKKSSSKMC